MTAKDVIKYLLKTNQHLMHQYLGDFTDAEMLGRPAPGANHPAWQIGHLISAEVNVFLSKVPGARLPKLPDGFAEQHHKDKASSDNPADFRTREEYLALYDTVRNTTLATLEACTDSDLEQPSNWADIAPKVWNLFVVIGDHDMMHGGQFTVARRKLGKKVVF